MQQVYLNREKAAWSLRAFPGICGSSLAHSTPWPGKLGAPLQALSSPSTARPLNALGQPCHDAGATHVMIRPPTAGTTQEIAEELARIAEAR